MFKDTVPAPSSPPDLLPDPSATGCSRPPPPPPPPPPPSLLPELPSSSAQDPHQAPGTGLCQDRCSPFPLFSLSSPPPLHHPHHPNPHHPHPHHHHAPPLPLPLQKPTSNGDPPHLPPPSALPPPVHHHHHQLDHHRFPGHTSDRHCSSSSGSGEGQGGGGGGEDHHRLVVARPMKKLLSWVKTVVFGARARLLWRSRCSRAGRQFRFLTLTESSSSSDLVDSCWSVLDEPAVSDVPAGEFQDEDVRTDIDDEEEEDEEGRDVFFQLGDEEKDNLVAEEDEEDDDEELEEAEEEEQEEEEAGSESSDQGVVVVFGRVFRTCRRKMSRVTVVSFLWSLLSLLVAGACAFSFYHPSWVSHPDRLHSFGLFTQCVRDPASSYPRAVCHGYGPGGRVDLGSVPAGAWQASSLLYGAGMCLQGLGALVSLALLLFLPPHPYSGRRVALLCGYVQTLAGRQTVAPSPGNTDRCVPTVTPADSQTLAHVPMEPSDNS